MESFGTVCCTGFDWSKIVTHLYQAGALLFRDTDYGFGEDIRTLTHICGIKLPHEISVEGLGLNDDIYEYVLPLLLYLNQSSLS